MPLFNIENTTANPLSLTNFKEEKILQNLIEKNLRSIFNCRFVATEYSTGSIHLGRIDTLALSEDDNPVIIEYKISPTSDLLSQSLYYLAWLKDHRGDFEIAVGKALGNTVEIDWNDIRVICLAPDYRKFDLHAAQAMGANLELWQYKLYENNYLMLEAIYSKSNTQQSSSSTYKDPKMVLAGRKAALTRKTASYSIEPLLNKMQPKMHDAFNTLREMIVAIGSDVQEVPKKEYIAYKTSQNFACIEPFKNKFKIFLKLTLKEATTDRHPIPSGKVRDVTNIGHFGTGNLECTAEGEDDLLWITELIYKSYFKIGG